MTVWERFRSLPWWAQLWGTVLVAFLALALIGVLARETGDDAAAPAAPTAVAPTTTTTGANTVPIPTTPTTLAPKSGAPCSTDGATLSRSSVSESGPYENLGLRCSKAVWTWVVKPRGSCGDTRFPNAVLADGTAVSCVNERYFAAGETLTDFFSGTYSVGTSTGQVPPGTYVVLNVRDCYWERVDRNGRTIDNDFVIGAPRVEVTIGRSDAGFTNKNWALPASEWVSWF